MRFTISTHAKNVPNTKLEIATSKPCVSLICAGIGGFDNSSGAIPSRIEYAAPRNKAPCRDFLFRERRESDNCHPAISLAWLANGVYRCSVRFYEAPTSWLKALIN